MNRISSSIEFGICLLQTRFPFKLGPPRLDHKITRFFCSKQRDFFQLSKRFYNSYNTYEMNLISWNINTIDLVTLQGFLDECRFRDIHLIALQEVNQPIIDNINTLSNYERINRDARNVNYSIAYRNGEYSSRQPNEKSYMVLWNHEYLTLQTNNHSPEMAYPELEFEEIKNFKEKGLEYRSPIRCEFTHTQTGSSFTLFNWHNEASSLAQSQYTKLEAVLSANLKAFGGSYIAAGDFNVTQKTIRDGNLPKSKWSALCHPPVSRFTAGVDHLLTNNQVVDYFTDKFKGFRSDSHYPISGKFTLTKN